MVAYLEAPVHICHVSRRSGEGSSVMPKCGAWILTCEVGPHHLYLSTGRYSTISEQGAAVRPRLAAPDVVACGQIWMSWIALPLIAPHTLEEKRQRDSATRFPRP